MNVDVNIHKHTHTAKVMQKMFTEEFTKVQWFGGNYFARNIQRKYPMYNIQIL